MTSVLKALCSSRMVITPTPALIQTTRGSWLAHMEATLTVFYRSYILNFSPQTPIIFLTSYHPALMQCSRTSEKNMLGFDTKPQQRNKTTDSPIPRCPKFPHRENAPLLTLTLQWHFTWLHKPPATFLASPCHPFSSSAPL